MDIREKALQVKGIFIELDTEIRKFVARTGIGCVEGCHGECCNKDVYATTLEFFPMAFELFREGKAEQILKNIENRKSSICVFYKRETDGTYGIYETRGLICRLFGFSSIVKKDGTSEMVTCKFIKDRFKQIMPHISNDIITSHYYRRLQAIDIRLSQRDLPINEAIRSAINTVGIFLTYDSSHSFSE